MRQDDLYKREELNYTIEEYIYELQAKIIPHWDKERFKQQAYSVFTADEILRLLHEDEDRSPLVIIEDYANKMDNYACRGGKMSFLFSVAYDVAINILDIALAMY